MECATLHQGIARACREALVHDLPMTESVTHRPAPRWVDTHCHLDAPEFAGQSGAVRQRAAQAGVAHCVIPAVERANLDTVRELAHQLGDSYALGIHPLCTGRAHDDDLQVVQTQLDRHRDDPRLVAVGEIGIDLFVPGLDAARQEHFFAAQLEMAAAMGLPVILHVRRSADRLLKHLRRCRVAGGIAHAFNGSLQQAHAFFELGFRLGFGGALTFDRALQLRRLAVALPAQAIVMETDAPDIPPHWLYRTAQDRAQGLPQGRNEPGELPRIAQVLAQLRGIDADEWAAQTTANAIDVLPRLAAMLAPRTERRGGAA
jgi:TatD DNase family protein